MKKILLALIVVFGLFQPTGGNDQSALEPSAATASHSGARVGW